MPERGGVRSFFTISQGHAFGAPGRPTPAGLVQWARRHTGMMRWDDSRGAAPWVAGGSRGVSPLWAADWPAASAWERTGAGRCRRAVTPAPVTGPATRRQASRWPALQERPGRPPAPGDPVAAKAHCQGRSLRSRPCASLRADP